MRTADEIRQESPLVWTMEVSPVIIAKMLMEIACQLAELNTRLSGMEIERITLIRTGATDVTYGSESKQTIERIGVKPDANR